MQLARGAWSGSLAGPSSYVWRKTGWRPHKAPSPSWSCNSRMRRRYPLDRSLRVPVARRTWEETAVSKRWVPTFHGLPCDGRIVGSKCGATWRKGRRKTKGCGRHLSHRPGKTLVAGVHKGRPLRLSRKGRRYMAICCSNWPVQARGCTARFPWALLPHLTLAGITRPPLCERRTASCRRTI